jgi:hypothetical protein
MNAGLAQADRHITECKGHIARQLKLIGEIAQRGQSTEWVEDMLRVLAMLRVFPAEFSRFSRMRNSLRGRRKGTWYSP